MSSGRKSSVTRLRELAEPRCRAALVCFLWQSYRDAVDQTVDMFDKLLTRASTQAQNELDEQLRRQRQTIQVSLTTLEVTRQKSCSIPLTEYFPNLPSTLDTAAYDTFFRRS